MGLSQGTNFAKYYHVLNRVDWSFLSASRILLNLLVSIATLQWTIQMIIKVGRWLKYTPINVVGDGGFACGELAWLCLKLKIGLITRLKMNARLHDFPSIDEPGKRGRKRTKGAKLFSFKEMIEMPDLGWKEIIVEGYGKEESIKI